MVVTAEKSVTVEMELQWYWVIRCIRTSKLTKTVISEIEVDHNPTEEEIADALLMASRTTSIKNLFVTVEYNARLVEVEN